MFVIKIKAFSSVASFRVPEGHTFQQTLPLPPITTLVGMMGAALGLTYQDALNYRDKQVVHFGISGSHRGEMRDLWKYNKVKSGEVLKDVLIREYLTDCKLTIIIGSQSEEVVSEIREGFKNPTYALSAGNSDNLMKLREISDIAVAKEELCSDFENTVLPGNQLSEYKPLIDFENLPVTYTVRSPRVFLLPTTFEFDGEERRVNSREEFTFVGSAIRIRHPVPSYRIGDLAVALL